MKAKNIILIVALFSTITCFGQNGIFDKFADRKDVTSVYISEAMFQMIPDMKMEGLDLGNMKGKMESLQILSTKDKKIAEEMRKAFSSMENREREELMRVQDGNTRASFFAIKKGELISELFMLADTESDFVVIQLLGNFTLQDVQEITAAISK